MGTSNQVRQSDARATIVCRARDWYVHFRKKSEDTFGNAKLLLKRGTLSPLVIIFIRMRFSLPLLTGVRAFYAVHHQVSLAG